MAKPKGRPRKDRQPSIHIMSISGESREFDFMPHLNTKGLPRNQRDIVNSLKDGRYMPHMSPTEYTAEIVTEDKKYYKGKTEVSTPIKYLLKAAPKQDIYDFTSKDTFDYSAAFKKKKGLAYSRLETVVKQFDKTNIPVLPRYYHNPLQYFDHILLADSYVNSFGGTIVDTYVDFIMPKNLNPVLKLRNPDKEGNPQQQQKVIEENQEIIEKLKAVDKFYSDDGPKAQDEYLGIPIMQKFKALITNHLVFGRDCLVFENWDHLPTFEFDGTKYDEIPNVLKIIQPIDMGMIEIDPYTMKLGGIYMYGNVPFVSTKNMIYLVNKYASPMIGSMYYGFSILQRAIDPVRLYRRILAQNLPQFIRTAHSGMGYFLFDSTQYPDAIRQKIRTNIVNSYKAGEIGIIDYANIKDFQFLEAKIHPEIMPLIELKNSLVKLTVSILGMPQSLIFEGTGDSTRATLVGKVVSFLNNQVTQLRKSIGTQLSSQWYMRNFRILYKDEKEILEKFYIDVEFEEMELETQLEKVERLLQLKELNPLKDEFIGEELGIDNYLDAIDTEKRDKQEEMQNNSPFPQFGKKPQSMFKVTDQDTGRSTRVSTRKTPV